MKKGISLITLIITIVVIIILAAAVILTLGNNNPINSSKIASLVESKGSMDSSISLMISKLMADTAGETTTKQVVKERVAIDDTTGIQVEKNGMNYEIYPISAEKFKNVLAMDIENTPSKNSSWYVSTNGKVFLVYQSIDQVPMSLKENNTINSAVDPFIILLESVEESEILGQVQITQDGSSNVNYNNIENGELSVTVPSEVTLKWEINQSAEKLGIDEAKYTNNLVNNKINLTTSPAGKYYLHMLVSKDGKNYEKIQEYSVVEKPDVWDGVSVATSFESGTGTQNDPYIIKNSAQLMYLRKTQNEEIIDYTGKYVKLDKDIDLNNSTYIPIADGNNGNRFKGTFDGNNHKIINMKIQPTTYNSGLFAKIENATIKNVAVYGTINNSTNNGQYGGICGYAKGTCLIQNCKNYVNIIALQADKVGGIIGEISANAGAVIENCINYGNIQADKYIGGIVGESYGVEKIENCINNGTVVSSSDNVGGIVGQVQYTKNILKCVNNNRITGSKNVSGIVGSIYSGKPNIFYCCNNGNVEAASYASGIASYGTGGYIIKQCYNTGDIKASSDYVAGISTTTGDEISNCYSKGSITCNRTTNSMGGIKSGRNPNVYNSYFLDTSCDRIAYVDEETDTSGSPRTEELFKKDYTQTDSITYLLNNGVTDNTRIWTIDSKINNGYPILKWQVE